MSEQAEGKAKKDARASGAKPRPEGRVREHGRRPKRAGHAVARDRSEAARLRAIEAADDASVIGRESDPRLRVSEQAEGRADASHIGRCE